MEPKFVLPSPNFNKNSKEDRKSNLHYLTPCGMTLLPRSKQPPPMYGARGSTVPAKYLKSEQQQSNSSSASTSTKISDTPPIYNSPPRPEYCANCGMELATEQDMKRHLEQHETCPAENCDFAALANVLERHIEAHHITGLYKSVKKVWTAEDIAAWRAERRKRFPTTANVELAKRAKEQRMKRGERLEKSKAAFGKSEDRRRTRPQNNNKDRPKQNKRQKNNLNKNDKKKEPQQLKESKLKEENPLPEKHNNISPSDQIMFCGTSQMKDYKHVKERVKPEVNALSNMLGMYGTDSENEGDESSDNEVDDSTPTTSLEFKPNELQPEDDPAQKGTQLDAENCQSPEAEDSSDNEVPDEVPIERKTEEIAVECKPETTLDETQLELPITTKTRTADKPNLDNRSTVKRAAPKKRNLGLNYKRARLMTKQNTMLSKLLETDIRHERNVLLQCVRYVCERNFFGIGNGTTSSSASSSTTRIDNVV
ncbi:nuclear fragile X mental retardation-interacting protein 1 [Drosophila innubila]|uniref:nuclear fragile X mental retardation-interacting protein 1 n=1 Tax=Drosophila innubila TaxID=198719 RepID=UPI00148B4A77|nr:nuclear fragile X mental retardation-interacting protein 1 [Drosophila innubila]